MAKKFSNARCVYCLEFFEELTSDHVFPKSWYPETTPQNIEKWQIPACYKCNQRYSVIEAELLKRFGLCIDPNELRSLGIADKALRALKPSCAKKQKDKRCRRKDLARILDSVIPNEKIPMESVLPNFGGWPGLQPEERIAITVSADQIDLFCEKLVRGLTYLKYSKYIEDNLEIDVFHVHEKNIPELAKEIHCFGQKHECGPGIKICSAFARDNSLSALFEIVIWGKLKMFASILPNKEL